MVFSSYNNSSYLPLDSDQGVTFYKNENLLFAPPPSSAVPSASVECRRNSPAAMPTATGREAGSRTPSHYGSVSDDFQPVTHLSSNGYYGYIPASSMPKMMSTEGAVNGTGSCASIGVGILLDCNPRPAVVDDTLMDCGASEMENYQQQQPQQHLRKRKECSEEVEEVNCKRRKTWLEQHQQQQHQASHAGFNHGSSWNQSSAHQMECHDQPMDSFAQQPYNESPVTMNGTPIGFNYQPQAHFAASQQPQQSQPVMMQPKNQLEASSNISSSRCFRWSATTPTVCSGTFTSNGSPTASILLESNLSAKHHQFGGGSGCSQELEDLFVSLHGSGLFLAG